MMYTLAYFCLTNTLSAISIWTPQILQSFNQGSSNITIGLLAAVPQICTILGWSTGAVTQIAARNEGITPPFLICSLPQVGYWLRQLITHDPDAGDYYGFDRIIQRNGDFLDNTGSVHQPAGTSDRYCGDQRHWQHWFSVKSVYDWLVERFDRQL